MLIIIKDLNTFITYYQFVKPKGSNGMEWIGNGMDEDEDGVNENIYVFHF